MQKLCIFIYAMFSFYLSYLRKAKKARKKIGHAFTFLRFFVVIKFRFPERANHRRDLNII